MSVPRSPSGSRDAHALERLLTILAGGFPAFRAARLVAGSEGRGSSSPPLGESWKHRVRQLRLELALDQAQVEELFALSREEALARLRRQLRFHRLGVALLLLQEAQDRWEAGEADRSFDLAELAFEILLRLGPNQLPVQNDAFAHIWTLFGVEAGFHRPTLADTFFQGAETFLEMGSGDPLAAAVVYRLRGEAQEAAGRRDEAQRAFELAARSYRKGADEEMAEELLRRFRSLESGP